MHIKADLQRAAAFGVAQKRSHLSRSAALFARLLFLSHISYRRQVIIVEDEAPLVLGVAVALGMSFSNKWEQGQL